MLARSIVIILLLFTSSVFAHLNHVQFAAVDEVNGKLRVRYRMSADMFMSNLDADIRNGRLNASIKQRPIDEIIRDYFKSHLTLHIAGTLHEADSAAFEFDPKTSDWIADFWFPVPASDAPVTLFCDAFLENNPRTQTLARIDWRGDKTMFHFRTGNVRYLLCSNKAAPLDAQTANEPPRDQFLDGLARALQSYDFLIAGGLVFAVLGHMLVKAPRITVPVLAIFVSAALSADQCTTAGTLTGLGFAIGFLAFVLTVYRLSLFVTRTR